MSDGSGAERITAAIDAASGTAICAYIPAGYPTLVRFPSLLRSTIDSADVVEVGVPFTDPMADGMTIQRASQVALENGVSLSWILRLLELEIGGCETPVLLMGYYNPFLAFGMERLGTALADAGVSGVIVPDLPYDEADDLLAALSPHGIALVQLVTPTTPDTRLARIAAVSQGCVYTVATTGVTGGETLVSVETLRYLSRVRAISSLPILAGFGIRDAAQIEALAPYVDGVVVGSALIEAIDKGIEPSEFIGGLRRTGAVL